MAETFNLTLPGEELKEELKKELAPTEHEKTELATAAYNYANQLMHIDLNWEEKRQGAINSIENLGMDLQKESAHKSTLLQTPIKEIAAKGEDGKDVSNALMNLRETVKSLDPTNIDFGKKGLLGKFFNPVKNYFQKYKKSETVLNDILESLDNGKEMLRRDNITLQQDQADMRELTKKIEKTIIMATSIDDTMQKEISRTEEQERKKFIEEELLFPLRQRVMDLQQQLAVNQQGVLAIEVLMRNNKELIRGVNRAKLVTVNALKVAVIVAKALSNQKLVMDQINALNSTTNDLLAGTAQRLKVQGVEIQKQASGAMLDAEKLKGAFADINAAMEEISTFRREALPRMAETISEFDKLTIEGEKNIKRLETGDKVNQLN